MGILVDKLEKGYSIYTSILFSFLYLIFLGGMVLFAYDFNIQGLKIHSKKILINILLVFIGFYIW